MKKINMIMVLLILSGVQLKTQQEQIEQANQMLLNSETAEEIQAALDAGADINVRDNDDMTALNWAIWRNDQNGVHLLLNAGVDVNVRDNRGRTALYWAAFYDNEDIVRMLLGWNDQIDQMPVDDQVRCVPLEIQTVQDALDQIEAALEEGIDIDQEFEIEVSHQIIQLLEDYIDNKKSQQAAVDVARVAVGGQNTGGIPADIMSKVYGYVAPKSNENTKKNLVLSINRLKSEQNDRNDSSSAVVKRSRSEENDGDDSSSAAVKRSRSEQRDEGDNIDAAVV